MIKANTIRFWAALAALVISPAGYAAEDSHEWRSFRGPHSSGYQPDAQVPTEWDVDSGTNIEWRAEVPGRGVCGPIIVGGKVIVSGSTGTNRDRMHIAAYDDATGKQLWHRQFLATGRTLMHPISANAAPTPVSDGERVFAFYSSNDLVCVDLDGNLQWMAGLAINHIGVGNDVGMASSPIVAGRAVVVLCQCQANSFAAAFDRESGELLWEIPRPPVANWSSPIAFTTTSEGKTTEAVAFQTSGEFEAYAADTGKLLWRVPLRCSSVPSPAGGEGMLFVPGSGITALALEGEGPPRQLWQESKLNAGNSTPVVAGEQLLLLNSAGVLTSASTKDGSVNWRKRLKGPYWSSPVVAGRYLYSVNDLGEARVVDLENEGKIVAECSFGPNQDVLGSPAVAGNALYVRSHQYLWKIASPAVDKGEAL
jgi:outer membrane protein assembly factor BamB